MATICTLTYGADELDLSVLGTTKGKAMQAQDKAKKHPSPFNIGDLDANISTCTLTVRDSFDKVRPWFKQQRDLGNIVAWYWYNNYSIIKLGFGDRDYQSWSRIEVDSADDAKVTALTFLYKTGYHGTFTINFVDVAEDEIAYAWSWLQAEFPDAAVTVDIEARAIAIVV